MAMQTDHGSALQTTKAKQSILNCEIFWFSDVKRATFHSDSILRSRQKFIISTVDRSVAILDLLFLGKTS